MYMYLQIIFGLVKLAERPPFRKLMPPQFTICSLCILAICCFSYFPFWFRGQGFGSGCAGSWSLLTFDFYD